MAARWRFFEVSKSGILQYSLDLPSFPSPLLLGSGLLTADGRVPVDCSGVQSSRLKIKWCRIRGPYHFTCTEIFPHALEIKCSIPAVCVLKNTGGKVVKLAHSDLGKMLVFPRWLCLKFGADFKTFIVREHCDVCYLSASVSQCAALEPICWCCCAEPGLLQQKQDTNCISRPTSRLPVATP